MEKTVFFDRLTGERQTTLSSDDLVGRWALCSDEPVQINNIFVNRGAFLLPMPDDKIYIAGESGMIVQAILNIPALGQQEKQKILTIGKILSKLKVNGAYWQKWVNTSLFQPDEISKLVQITEFEKALQKYGWHLAQVCNKPYSHLATEIEKMPISQARRIPTRSYQYLAGHTEDWEYSTLTTVFPRKILSALPQEYWDFYENRVASRLVEEIHEYFLNRIKNITNMEELLKQTNPDQYNFEIRHSTRMRLARVCKLFEKAVLDRKVLEEHIKIFRTGVLRPLEQENKKLLDSTLYGIISPVSRKNISMTPRITNIFANDRHYRFVNLLWVEFLKQRPKQNQSNEEIQQELQEYFRAFSNYCLLLVLIALKNLGFQVDKLNNLGSIPNNRIDLRSYFGQITLDWDEEFKIAKIWNDSKLLLRIVPMPVALTLGHKKNYIENRLRKLHNLFSQSKKQSDRFKVGITGLTTLVIYPGTQEERNSLAPELKRLACSTSAELLSPTQFGLIPIDVYELDGVERIGRALRWSFFSNFFAQYPVKIPVPAKYRQDILKLENLRWIRPGTEMDFVVLVQSSEEKENSRFRSILSNWRNTLESQGKKNQLEIERFDKLFEALDSAELIFQNLRTCPVCHKESRPQNFQSLDQECFKCHCDDCKAEWGLRPCPLCKERYPYLGFSNAQLTPSFDDRDYDPEWVDKAYGMDVLATPCSLSGSRMSFICPFCRDCSGQNTQNETCLGCKISQGSIGDAK
jgi:hypothetical protein